MEPKRILILRTGQRIVFEPSPPWLINRLEPEFSFTEKVFLRGQERRRAVQQGLSPVYDQTWVCCNLDIKGRLATSYGFYERARDALEVIGCTVDLQEETPARHRRDSTIFEPRWDRVFELFEPRTKQDEALLQFVLHDHGRIDCPPGWGKGTVIVMTCCLWPKARIHVVTDSCDVLCNRLYPELCSYLPSVGIVGGGRRVLDRRVMCYSADSLHHADPNACDVLLVDECHQAGADRFSERLANYQYSRNYGLSASHEQRFDGKDRRIEAIFGPKLLTVTYQEAQADRMVVPIMVFWRNVTMDINPCAGLHDVAKKQAGIWSNRYRNELIAEDARSYDKDVQVMVAVDTIEHGLYLKKLLPEFSLLYATAGLKPRDYQHYRKIGLVGSDFRHMDDDRRQKLTDAAISGRLKKFIVTSIFNVGVDLRQLAVMVRADGGGSAIKATQLPGRTSRIFDGKEIAVVHDYLDQFDQGMRQQAHVRSDNYAKHGWDQRFPPGARLRDLKQRHLWGDYE